MWRGLAIYGLKCPEIAFSGSKILYFLQRSPPDPPLWAPYIFTSGFFFFPCARPSRSSSPIDVLDLKNNAERQRGRGLQRGVGRGGELALAQGVINRKQRIKERTKNRITNLF